MTIFICQSDHVRWSYRICSITRYKSVISRFVFWIFDHFIEIWIRTKRTFRLSVLREKNTFYTDKPCIWNSEWYDLNTHSVSSTIMLSFAGIDILQIDQSKFHGIVRYFDFPFYPYIDVHKTQRKWEWDIVVAICITHSPTPEYCLLINICSSSSRHSSILEIYLLRCLIDHLVILPWWQEIWNEHINF